MYFCREQDTMWSRLSAHHKTFVRLIAGILTFPDKKYRILTFCDKKYHLLMFRNETDFFNCFATKQCSDIFCKKRFLSQFSSHFRSFWANLPFTVAAPEPIFLSWALSAYSPLTLALSGSLLLYVAQTLAPTGSLCQSLAQYCSLISLLQSLIDSYGPCLVLSAAATLAHFFPVCHLCLVFLLLSFLPIIFLIQTFLFTFLSVPLLLVWPNIFFPKYFPPIPSQLFFSSRIFGLQSQDWVWHDECTNSDFADNSLQLSPCKIG